MIFHTHTNRRMSRFNRAFVMGFFVHSGVMLFYFIFFFYHEFFPLFFRTMFPSKIARTLHFIEIICKPSIINEILPSRWNRNVIYSPPPHPPPPFFFTSSEGGELNNRFKLRVRGNGWESDGREGVRRTCVQARGVYSVGQIPRTQHSTYRATGAEARKPTRVQ